MDIHLTWVKNLKQKIDAGRKKALKSALINYALKKNKGKWYYFDCDLIIIPANICQNRFPFFACRMSKNCNRFTFFRLWIYFFSNRKVAKTLVVVGCKLVKIYFCNRFYFFGFRKSVVSVEMYWNRLHQRKATDHFFGSRIGFDISLHAGGEWWFGFEPEVSHDKNWKNLKLPSKKPKSTNVFQSCQTFNHLTKKPSDNSAENSTVSQFLLLSSTNLEILSKKSS